ncbi:MAG: hypothetical protein J3K34DRAFT_261123 [Monoraphidium minutum]|nr:MAG: hypothetical protein J3K34DRAFT_261123 [Monoraphidium minutum]
MASISVARCPAGGLSWARRPARRVAAPMRAAGFNQVGIALEPPSTRDDLRARLVSAGVLTLGRDFCAAFGLATLALGYAQGAGWCGAGAHDRLLLLSTDAALAWGVWRAAGLGGCVLPRAAGGGGGGGPSASADAALAALAWGASGTGLADMVDSQVQALHIQLLRKEATILALKRMMDDGGSRESGEWI